MNFFIESIDGGQRAYKSELTNDPAVLRSLSNTLVKRMLEELAREPMCIMDLAKRLREHEQKIYYHSQKLERLRLIEVRRVEERGGAMAKVYAPVAPVVSFMVFDSEPITDVKTNVNELWSLKPFVVDGRLNSTIVLGSPEPHGRFKASASDGYCAIDLCLFIGQFLVRVNNPCYKLDTQLREEDFNENMILVGGPKANIISDRVNNHLPIRFDYSDNLSDWLVVSSLSGRTYREKNVGVISRIQNPFANDKEILILAGKGFRGTRAAVLGFVKHTTDVERGNSAKEGVRARVVTGIDLDSDGLIDDVEFIE